MALLTREALLRASDLEDKEIELPTLGGSVRVRSLPAAYSNEAHSEAMEQVTTEHKGRAQVSLRVNSVKLEALKVLHGLVEPKLNSIADANTFAQQCGRAWQTIVKAIDDLSGLDAEKVERTEAMFHPGGSVEAQRDPAVPVPDGGGNGGSAVPVRAGA